MDALVRSLVPVQAEWMMLLACIEDFQTGERECTMSGVVHV